LTLKLGKKWTYSDVVTDFHREELHNMALELSGEKAGSPKYLSCYKKSLKIIKERLTDETRVKYRAEVKKWMEDMPPPQQQRWYVHPLHLCGQN